MFITNITMNVKICISEKKNDIDRMKVDIYIYMYVIHTHSYTVYIYKRN
jgi:hypothetical protein